MELTWIGLMLMPLGVLFFFFRPDFLFYITIISVPFASTSLLNSASGSPLFSVQYFGALFIVRFLPKYLFENLFTKQRCKTSYKSEYLSIFYLWLFTGVVLLTMIMPYLTQGRLTTVRGEGVNAGLINIELSMTTLSQVLPVLFGALLSTTFVMHIKSIKLLLKSLRIYVAAVIFVAMWGLMQFFLENILHISYPYWIFNTAVSESTLGYLSSVDIDYVRITSVAFEPSLFAKQNLIVIPILVFGLLRPKLLFRRSLNFFFLILLVVSIFLSASTTGFIGLPLLIVIIFYFLRKLGLLSSGKQLVILFAIIAFASAFMFSLSGIALEVVDKLLINKSESDSAAARIFSIYNALDYFTSYPILGVGWGFVTSHDIIVNLLANSGVIGLLTFLLMILQPLYRGFYLLKLYPLTFYKLVKQPPVLLVIGLMSAEMLMLILGLISGYEFYLAYPYITLGFLISSNSYLLGFMKNEVASKISTLR